MSTSQHAAIPVANAYQRGLCVQRRAIAGTSVSRVKTPNMPRTALVSVPWLANRSAVVVAANRPETIPMVPRPPKTIHDLQAAREPGGGSSIVTGRPPVQGLLSPMTLGLADLLPPRANALDRRWDRASQCGISTSSITGRSRGDVNPPLVANERVAGEICCAETELGFSVKT